MVGRIFTIAFRLLCDPQWLCVHTAIASLRFSLASRPSAHSNPWTAYRPRCAACSDLANCILAWPYGQAHAFYPLARSPPALRGASACLNYIAIEMLSLCGWPHLRDCFQITLRSAMAVCPHSDCMIAFQLGLFRPSVFSLTLGSLTARVARRQCASTIAIAMLSLRRAAAIACK